MRRQPPVILLLLLLGLACADEAPSGEASSDTGGTPEDVGDDGSDAAPDTADVGPDTTGPPDFDNDGHLDADDNCPGVANRDQADLDGDGVGDACDLCPASAVVGATGADEDGDGVADVCDNCPSAANPGQADFDNDGIGNICTAPPCVSEVLCAATAAADPVCCDVGDECIEGACTAPCDFGVRCGGVCCGDGELCQSDVCVARGAPCIGSTDCPLDEFCDHILQACLPITIDAEVCEHRPDSASFEPTVEWSWTSSTTLPDLDQVITMPLVGDLNSDGTPDVLIVTSDGFSASASQAVLRLLDGITGEPIWPTTADVYSPAYFVQSRVTPAVGDIDNDGAPEIVTATPTGLIAFEHDGSFKWFATDGGAPWSGQLSSSAVSLADLEGDGSVEIIVAGLVFEADGALRFNNGTLAGSSDGGYGAVSVVADINNDNLQEIVTGNAAWGPTGTEVWSNTEKDGYTAIADLDLDGTPEVVVIASGEIRVQRGSDGVVLASTDLPATGRGGPPTVADFDADGLPEIATANGGAYTVFEFEEGPPAVLTEKWSTPTQDLSSNVTGSSVFDFEGDGAAEVVYNDECYLRFYSGVDGTVLFETPNPSATIFEYPVVADVDRDGSSEVIVAANNGNHGDGTGTCPTWMGITPFTGVFVYGNAANDWVRTRFVWNQHSYHVTNVNDDLTVPSPEAVSWGDEGFNNYRQSIQGIGVFNAPDLQVEGVQISRLTCPASQEVAAFVVNRGDLTVAPGVAVAFYGAAEGQAAVLIEVARTTTFIPPGGSERVAISRVAPSTAYTHFEVVADDDGLAGSAVTECLEDNNQADLDTTCLCQPEVCNGIDDNCNGVVDEGFDGDADGYPDCGGDCDDENPDINPDQIETCDQIDNDCDGSVDEGANCG